MSISAMNSVWKRSTPRGAARLVLLALADWADDEGHTWYSISRLAAKSAVTDRHVKRIVHELVRDGFLAITHRRRDNGDRDTNVYHILPGLHRKGGGSDTLSPG